MSDAIDRCSRSTIPTPAGAMPCLAIFCSDTALPGDTRCERHRRERMRIPTPRQLLAVAVEMDEQNEGMDR